MTSKCTCASCKRWDRLIKHKRTFTATELGLEGGHRAKQAYIAKLRTWQAQECEQKESDK